MITQTLAASSSCNSNEGIGEKLFEFVSFVGILYSFLHPLFVFWTQEYTLWIGTTVFLTNAEKAAYISFFAYWNGWVTINGRVIVLSSNLSHVDIQKLIRAKKLFSLLIIQLLSFAKMDSDQLGHSVPNASQVCSRSIKLHVIVYLTLHFYFRMTRNP